MLPLRARVLMEAMAMKENSAFPKTQALLEPTIRLFHVISKTFVFLAGEGSYPSA